MNSEYVLFLGGGKWQKPWLLFLKNKGHRIILVDPYDFSPCVPLADIHVQLNVKDTDGILQAVQDKHYAIQFVTSDQTDVSVLPVAEISQKLNLPANPPEVVRIFSNKFENRLFLDKVGFSHKPQFIKATNQQQVLDFYKKLGRDIIIKPVDAQSSRGIAKVGRENIQQLPALFIDALAFSNEQYIIAEEFMQGREITVEGICINNHHTILAVSAKKHFRTGIASELRYPADLSPAFLKELSEFHNAFIQKTGLKFGLTHSEYIIDEGQDGFWLVEAACRGGGSLIPSHIVPWVSGVDVYEAFYKLLMHEEVKLPATIQTRSALLYFFEFSSGRVKKMEGIQEAKKIHGVLDIDFEFSEGDIIKPAADDRSRQGYAIIFAEDPGDLQKKLEEVLATIRITIEK